MPTVRYPTPKQLSADLNAGPPESIYLFMGEEEGEKEKYIAKMKSMLFSGAGDAAQHTGRFHIEFDELMKAADFCLSQSMFSAKKLCVMLNIERIHSGSPHLALFRELLRDLPDHTHLVMTTAENKVPACVDVESQARIRIFQFWKHFERDLAAYASRRLSESGVGLDADLVSLLVELSGRSVKVLDDAVERIKSFNADKAMTREALLDIIADERSATLFEFSDALFRGQKRALDLLKKLLENNWNEFLILSHLVRQTEHVERFHAQARDGIDPDESLRRIGVPARRRNDMIEWARRNPPEKIKALFPMLQEADAALKSPRPSRSMVAHPLFELAAALVGEREEGGP